MQASHMRRCAGHFFAPDPAQRRVAGELYASIATLAIVSPHSHVDPRLLADENASLGTPVDLFIIPDHYVFRMLYSQGIPLEALGVPGRDGHAAAVEHRQVWQIFADNFYLFRGTPTGIWLEQELREVFGIEEPLRPASAQHIYDELTGKMGQPEFRPRALFERFNIQTLCTTDAASDSLRWHQAIRDSGWSGDVRPTFRPDGVVNLLTPGWRSQIDALSDIIGREVSSYASLITALEDRRAFFKRCGATATDHDAETAYTARLEPAEAEAVFARALQGEVTAEDARRFRGHMLIEMARMSIEDGLVMQLHVGSFRNHNRQVFEAFGPDRGGDIPVAGEFTRDLRPLLDAYGNDRRLTLILFTLDESTYGRELAPLAGHYPAIRLGPPWWFNDSLSGMARYFDRVVETAGLYNTVGFNDDTRSFVSIPVRHDVWRRASANWLAGLVIQGIVDQAAAAEMAYDMACGLALRAYKLMKSARSRD